ncbi:MAG: ectoine hydroxylase-related dioxygenase (phytanoyl-CoA dioxygenase family), partial [bacterium]
MNESVVSQEQIDTYSRDGVVLIPGLLTNWVDIVRQGIETNLREPGPYAAENLHSAEPGRFFDDYCNWSRIKEFERCINESLIAKAAAALMQSTRVQLFHDHVLVKEPGTSKPTPWHQDSPYYCVEGEQTLSFWIPMDPVNNTSLRCVAGSHQWRKPVLPTRWLSDTSFYPDSDAYMEVPDPDAQGMDIREWEMQAGDAVAFHFGILHGARGNDTNQRRRAFSVRLVGDDARYVQRPGPTSPPFTGHGMSAGDRLREDWF